MISDQESARLFEELSGLLREHNLGWAVEQVSQRIALGKTVRTKEVRPLAEVVSPEFRLELGPPFHPTAPRKLVPGKAAEFLASEEYSQREQLLLLIDAIERVTVDPIETEAELLIAFSLPDQAGAKRVRFVAEREESESLAEVSEDMTLSRRPQAERLRQLLNELREVV